MRETKLWTWHMAAGVLILILLGLHMTTMHLGGITGLFVANRAEEPVARANSEARDANFTLTIGYVLLLGAGLYHGLYGLRTMLFELTLKPALEKTISFVLLILGLGLFGLGTWAALTAHHAVSVARG